MSYSLANATLSDRRERAFTGPSGQLLGCRVPGVARRAKSYCPPGHDVAGYRRNQNLGAQDTFRFNIGTHRIHRNSVGSLPGQSFGQMAGSLFDASFGSQLERCSTAVQADARPGDGSSSEKEALYANTPVSQSQEYLANDRL